MIVHLVTRWSRRLATRLQAAARRARADQYAAHVAARLIDCRLEGVGVFFDDSYKFLLASSALILAISHFTRIFVPLHAAHESTSTSGEVRRKFDKIGEARCSASCKQGPKRLPLLLLAIEMIRGVAFFLFFFPIVAFDRRRSA